MSIRVSRSGASILPVGRLVASNLAGSLPTGAAARDSSRGGVLGGGLDRRLVEETRDRRKWSVFSGDGEDCPVCPGFRRGQRNSDRRTGFELRDAAGTAALLDGRRPPRPPEAGLSTLKTSPLAGFSPPAMASGVQAPYRSALGGTAWRRCYDVGAASVHTVRRRPNPGPLPKAGAIEMRRWREWGESPPLRVRVWLEVGVYLFGRGRTLPQLPPLPHSHRGPDPPVQAIPTPHRGLLAGQLHPADEEPHGVRPPGMGDGAPPPGRDPQAVQTSD